MAKPIVLIAEELSPATIGALGSDFDIRTIDGTNRAELLAAVPGAKALLVRSATSVDADVIAAGSDLVVIARAGVGLDNVDITAATAAGIMVVNAPTSNVISAAELAIGHLLSLARFIPDANASTKAGQWKRSQFTGVEFFDKTVGIVGLGRIGALVAERLSGFGVTLIAYDPFVPPARAQQLGVQMVELDQLMERADFITIHIPKTAETTGLIGAAQFANAKSTLRIVNASRGGIIDETALFDALSTKRIAAAGLDVFVNEPPTDSPLLGLTNIQLTPHLGASTDEAQEKAGVSVAKSVRLALDGELVPDAVNVAGERSTKPCDRGCPSWKSSARSSPGSRATPLSQSMSRCAAKSLSLMSRSSNLRHSRNLQRDLVRTRQLRQRASFRRAPRCVRSPGDRNRE